MDIDERDDGVLCHGGNQVREIGGGVGVMCEKLHVGERVGGGGGGGGGGGPL